MASSEPPLPGSPPRKRVDLQGRANKIESANNERPGEFEVPDLWPKGVDTCSPVEYKPGSWNQEASFQRQATELLSKNVSNNAMETRWSLLLSSIYTRASNRPGTSGSITQWM